MDKEIKKQAIYIGGGLIAAYLVYNFLKGEVKEGAKAVKEGAQEVGKVGSKLLDNTPQGLIKTVFNEIGGIFAGMQGNKTDTQKEQEAKKSAAEGGIEFNLGNITPNWGVGLINWLTGGIEPKKTEGDPKISVPPLIAKPIVYPSESQTIVDKTLKDSFPLINLAGTTVKQK